jgi:hypothetical protein
MFTNNSLFVIFELNIHCIQLLCCSHMSISDINRYLERKVICYADCW